ncbi:unnamed protein product, partial [Chrysoparadoxa australica]
MALSNVTLGAEAVNKKIAGYQPSLQVEEAKVRRLHLELDLSRLIRGMGESLSVALDGVRLVVVPKELAGEPLQSGECSIQQSSNRSTAPQDISPPCPELVKATSLEASPSWVDSLVVRGLTLVLKGTKGAVDEGEPEALHVSVPEVSWVVSSGEEVGGAAADAGDIILEGKPGLCQRLNIAPLTVTFKGADLLSLGASSASMTYSYPRVDLTVAVSSVTAALTPEVLVGVMAMTSQYNAEPAKAPDPPPAPAPAPAPVPLKVSSQPPCAKREPLFSQ